MYWIGCNSDVLYGGGGGGAVCGGMFVCVVGEGALCACIFCNGVVYCFRLMGEGGICGGMFL